MNYITSLEAAKKWNLTKRRVNSLCQQGLIPGAVMDGYRWRIPADFEYKSGKKVGSNRKNVYYTYNTVSDNSVFMLAEETNYVVNKRQPDDMINVKKYDKDFDYSDMILREDGNYYPRRPLPVGVTSFVRASESCCYVDKTMLIADVLNSSMQVSLFTRPRRFGKTINMDMLRVFFETSTEDTSVYFKDKKIWQCDEWIRLEQGKYPVVFVSFKDVKYASWSNAFGGLKSVIADEFKRHDYLLDSENLSDDDKTYIRNMLGDKLEEGAYYRSLRKLSDLLRIHHRQNAMIIIDEYDTPINEAFHRGYYDEMIGFMRVFLSLGLKDNPSLEKGFMTGILRVAKEGLFSGLNNIAIYSVLDEKYSEYFGFTLDEVKSILYEYGKSFKIDEVIEWYDGYRIGDHEIFNPWSVINYVDYDFKPRPYWTQTSSNTMLGDIMVNATEIIGEQLKQLMSGQCIYSTIDTTVIYPELEASTGRVLSFLMMAGYITVEEKELDEEGYEFCKVRIPNREVRTAYRREIVNRYCDNISSTSAEIIAQALRFKDFDKLQETLETFLMKSVSYYDTTNESFYHGLILGMVGMFNIHYEVSSNKEAGNGRYDIMLKPRDKCKPAYIIELKNINDESEDLDSKLEKTAISALHQIVNQKYYEVLSKEECNDVVLMGIAFHKKKCCIKTKKIKK